MRLKHLSQANEDEAKAQKVQESLFKDVQQKHEWDWSSQANQGNLSSFQLGEALAGRNIYISPDKAREYAKINANPPDISGSSGGPVLAIMQDYHLGDRSRANIDAARKRLNAAFHEMGKPSPLIDKALNELQSDSMSLRTVEAAEMSAKIQYAGDRFKAQSEQKLPGMIGTMQKNQEEIDKAEMNMRIRKGEKPDAILDDMKKRREEKKAAVPERNKGVLDLLK